MILMSFKDAGELFGKLDVATDIQIHTLPGHNSEIATDLYDIFQNEPYRLQDKHMVELYFKKGSCSRKASLAHYISSHLPSACLPSWWRPASDYLSGKGKSVL